MLPIPLLLAIPVALMVATRRRTSSRSSVSVIDARSTDEGQQNRNFRHRFRGRGRWRHGVIAPIGFVARPGAPAHLLEPGTCAEYEGSGGRWYLCCKHTDGSYSCSLLRFGDATIDPRGLGPRLRNHRSVPERNRRHGGGGGHFGGRPFGLRAWHTWPLAPWAIPSTSQGVWTDAAPPPTGCRIVTGKAPRQLASGECALYHHRGKDFICVRDEHGRLRCMSRLVYLRQPAFA